MFHVTATSKSTALFSGTHSNRSSNNTKKNQLSKLVLSNINKSNKGKNSSSQPYQINKKLIDLHDNRLHLSNSTSTSNTSLNISQETSFKLPYRVRKLKDFSKPRIISSTRSRSKRHANRLKPCNPTELENMKNSLTARGELSAGIGDALSKEFIECVKNTTHKKKPSECCAEFGPTCSGCSQACAANLKSCVPK